MQLSHRMFFIKIIHVGSCVSDMAALWFLLWIFFFRRVCCSSCREASLFIDLVPLQLFVLSELED